MAEVRLAEHAALDVTVKGFRSDKGSVRLAICPPAAGFPDCKNRAVRSATVPVEHGAVRVQFSDLPRGQYAIGVFHDANGNGKLDTFVGIPKEGFGFSRNPPLRPRAPRWDEAVVDVESPTAMAIQLRYIL